MTSTQQTETTPGEVRGSTPTDWFILTLVLAFIAACNGPAMQDRLLLFLYSLGVAGAVFALLKRGALVFTAVVLAAASTTLLVNVYFQTATESWHPMVDGVRDFVGLSILAAVAAKLIQEFHRTQRERVFGSTSES